MVNGNTLLLKQLEDERNARRHADKLLEQKSLEFENTNHHLQSLVDAKTDELHQLNEYKKAVDKSTIISIADKNGVIIYVNDAFVKTSGYSKDELIGSPHNIIRHPDNSSAIFSIIWKTILNKQTWQSIIKNRAKNGSTYYVDTTITPILTSNGEIEKFISIRHDITKVFEQKQLINRQLINSLTGLPNRLKLIQDLEKRQHNALSIFNIDAFQEINKLYGNMVGDEVLKSVAAYFSENIGKEWQIYKLPEDKFAILCIESCDEDACKKIIIPFIQQLSENIFQIGEHEIHLSMTAGVSYGNDVDILINANIALNNAKKLKSPFELYNLTEQEEKYYANNQKMIKSLKYALTNDQIIPYFQPIYNNKTFKIDKYEVLMRLIDKEGEVLSPDIFLDIAHKVKVYPELTKIIIRKAFAMFQDKDIIFSINISIEDIRNKITYTYIIDMLTKFNRPHNVIFEIVESAEIENYTMIKAFVKEIKKYGGKIAIDDFGSGYSNFMHLLELKTNFIKIDGSIIKNILHDRNSQILTQTIVTMANKLDIGVIAEFVNSKEILDVVMSVGIDYSQGYYFGEPKPILAEFDEKAEAVSMPDTVLDLKKRYITENQLMSLGVIVESSLNEIYIFDSENLYFTYANKAGQDSLGYSMEELSRLTVVDIKPEYTMESFLKLIEPLQNDSKDYLDFNACHQRKNGSEYIAEIRLRNLKINGSKQFAVIAQDITERVHLEEELRKLAMTDSLTGIYNRYKINLELDVEMERAKRYESTFACVMLDIDYFKKVNDIYGHNIGDNILKEITSIISKQIRKTDCFGRWGGEEFMILLPELNEEQATIFTEKLRKTIANHSFEKVPQITGSFGVTVFKKSDTKESLLKRIDDALYQAKNQGRNQIVSY